jgi:hypothetical protein
MILLDYIQLRLPQLFRDDQKRADASPLLVRHDLGKLLV